MKTIEIPKGVKIACGKRFEFMEGDNIYDGICGQDEDGLCKECKDWNDANRDGGVTQ